MVKFADNTVRATRHPQTDNSIVKIENLQFRYADGTLGVGGINLAIQEGAFVVMAGANGSGKTTLLRHLNGLLSPSAGSVHIDGVSVADNPRRARQLVGMMFQDADSQIVGETVYEDVAFGPENLRLSREEINGRVASALGDVGLTHLADRRPHTLSGGEKRRLAIAGILAMQPRVIIFDEPFSSLDYPGVKQVLQQIVDLHHSGHTIIITTHDLDKVLFHADRLIFMQAGKVVRDGQPNEIIVDGELFGVRPPCVSRLGLEASSWLN